MSKPKDKGILPGLSYEEKPGKNFLLENIKKLREIQRETQKKLATQNQTNGYYNHRKVPDLKIRSYQKRNKSEPDLGSENPSLKSRLSTPVTAMASPKPVKNQKMQTVTMEKGRVIQARGATGSPPMIKKAQGEIKKKTQVKMQRSASLPSISLESEAVIGTQTSSDEMVEDRSSVRINQEMLERLISGEKKDFVTYNTYRTYHEKVKPKKPDPIKPPPSYRIGEIPKYLLSSQKDVEPSGGSGDADQKDKSPGFILLSERERKDHLEEFKKGELMSDSLKGWFANGKEFKSRLRNVPLSSDSYSTRQRKMQLEKELEKLEDLMKLFSRGRLYIKVS